MDSERVIKLENEHKRVYLVGVGDESLENIRLVTDLIRELPINHQYFYHIF